MANEVHIELKNCVAVEVPVETVVYKPPPREGPIVREANVSVTKSYADSQMLRTAAPVLSPGMVTSFSSGLVSSGMHTSQRRVNSVGGKKIGVGVKLRRNAQVRMSGSEAQ